LQSNVAHQGEAGAFSEEACRRFLPDRTTLRCPSFEDVVQAVLDGAADAGMLPIENSCAGPVPGLADLLARSAVRIVRRVELPIRMHLLAQRGATLGSIHTVASHPVALGQCSAALKELGVDLEEASNTAAAARSLAASDEGGRAVLASERAATLYGLTILRHDLQDRADNVTTFAVIARA